MSKRGKNRATSNATAVRGNHSVVNRRERSARRPARIRAARKCPLAARPTVPSSACHP